MVVNRHLSAKFWTDKSTLKTLLNHSPNTFFYTCFFGIYSQFLNYTLKINVIGIETSLKNGRIVKIEGNLFKKNFILEWETLAVTVKFHELDIV